MPRSETPILSDDPVAEFAKGLRELRENARLSYRALSRAAHYSAAALSYAASGRSLPSIEVTMAYVQACGGDPVAWRGRWQAARLAAPAGAEPSAAVPARAAAVGLPSLTPPLGNLPARIHGRDELLAALTATFQESRVVVLHGIGGVGKTSVALEAARRNGPDAVTWWVRADSSIGVASSMRALARQLGAPVDEAAGGGWLADHVWSLLERVRTPWLLVFDGADDPSALQPDGTSPASGTGWLRPPGKLGKVLVTSRYGNPHSWGRYCELHLVTPLSGDDGALLLQDLTKRGAGSTDDALLLANRLGGLPLALTLAGKYLAPRDAIVLTKRAKTYAEYTRALDEQFDKTTTATVDETLNHSLRLLADRGLPLARDLMRMFSVMDSDEVPLESLDVVKLAAHPPFTELTEQSLSTLLTELLRFALIDVEDRTVRVHPLVRRAVRDSTPPTEVDRLRGIAASLLAGSPGPQHTTAVKHERGGVPRLTPREVEVLATWFEAGSRAGTAKKLGITERTVASYLERVRLKYFDVGRPAPTTVTLIRHALEDGIITVRRRSADPAASRDDDGAASG